MRKDGLEIAWPDSVDDDTELAFILGRPNFWCGSIAHTYRLAGFDIKPKAEAEQAFVIHRMIRFWAVHGDRWRDKFTADVRQVQEEVTFRLHEARQT